jgi:hypothetical protein
MQVSARSSVIRKDSNPPKFVSKYFESKILENICTPRPPPPLLLLPQSLVSPPSVSFAGVRRCGEPDVCVKFLIKVLFPQY